MGLVVEIRYKNPTKGFSGSFMVELLCCLEVPNVTFFLVAGKNVSRCV
jgi:hypothetical protein